MGNFLDRLFNRQSHRASDSSRRSRDHSRAAERDWDIDDAFLGRLRRVSLISRRGITSGLTGEHASPRKASALEFADYRSYSPGDELRRVDWNAYLRLDHLLVKLSDAPERVDLHVLLDGSSSMDWGSPEKFRYGQRLAIGLSYVALSHMDTVNLMVLHGGECLRVSQQESARAMPLLVRAMGTLRPEGPTNLNVAVSAFARQRSRRGVVVLISDLLSPDGYEAALERLSGSSLRPVVIHLLSPEEMAPSLEGDLELQDIGTGDTIQVSVDWATRARYQQWLSEWFAGIESFCSRRGITYVRVETSQPVEELLLGRLQREKVLA